MFITYLFGFLKLLRLTEQFNHVGLILAISPTGLTDLNVTRSIAIVVMNGISSRTELRVTTNVFMEVGRSNVNI